MGATRELGTCEVGDVAHGPCRRPATVKIGGVPFCAACAREQEAYFAIGELVDAPEGVRDGRLSEALGRLRRTTARRKIGCDGGPDGVRRGARAPRPPLGAGTPSAQVRSSR